MTNEIARDVNFDIELSEKLACLKCCYLSRILDIEAWTGFRPYWAAHIENHLPSEQCILLADILYQDFLELQGAVLLHCTQPPNSDGGVTLDLNRVSGSDGETTSKDSENWTEG